MADVTCCVDLGQEARCFNPQALLFLLRSLPYEGPTVQLAGASAVIIHSFLPQVFVFRASSVRGLHWALGAEKDKTHPCPCGVTPVSTCNLGAQGRTGVTQGQDTGGLPLQPGGTSGGVRIGFLKDTGNWSGREGTPTERTARGQGLVLEGRYWGHWASGISICS